MNLQIGRIKMLYIDRKSGYCLRAGSVPRAQDDDSKTGKHIFAVRTISITA